MSAGDGDVRLLSSSCSPNLLTRMSFEGLDHSDFGSLTNTSCLNFSTMDLSIASTALMNSFISNLSELTYNPNLSQQFWISMFCVTLFGLIINSLFVLTVVKTPFLHTTIYILLASLACSHCIFLITRVDQIVRILFDYPAIINMGRAVSACLTILCFFAINWSYCSGFYRTILGYLSSIDAPLAKRN